MQRERDQPALRADLGSYRAAALSAVSRRQRERERDRPALSAVSRRQRERERETGQHGGQIEDHPGRQHSLQSAGGKERERETGQHGGQIEDHPGRQHYLQSVGMRVHWSGGRTGEGTPMATESARTAQNRL
jgi:hypothetical protein